MILDWFETTSASIDVDGSVSIGTVVYTVRVQSNQTALDTSTTSGISSSPLPPPVPLIRLVTPSSPFELHPVNNSKYCIYISFL